MLVPLSHNQTLVHSSIDSCLFLGLQVFKSSCTCLWFCLLHAFASVMLVSQFLLLTVVTLSLFMLVFYLCFFSVPVYCCTQAFPSCMHVPSLMLSLHAIAQFLLSLFLYSCSCFFHGFPPFMIITLLLFLLNRLVISSSAIIHVYHPHFISWFVFPFCVHFGRCFVLVGLFLLCSMCVSLALYLSVDSHSSLLPTCHLFHA